MIQVWFSESQDPPTGIGIIGFLGRVVDFLVCPRQVSARLIVSLRF